MTDNIHFLKYNIFFSLINCTTSPNSKKVYHLGCQMPGTLCGVRCLEPYAPENPLNSLRRFSGAWGSQHSTPQMINIFGIRERSTIDWWKENVVFFLVTEKLILMIQVKVKEGGSFCKIEKLFFLKSYFYMFVVPCPERVGNFKLCILSPTPNKRFSPPPNFLVDHEK